MKSKRMRKGIGKGQELEEPRIWERYGRKRMRRAKGRVGKE